jgi:hypothetical protein
MKTCARCTKPIAPPRRRYCSARCQKADEVARRRARLREPQVKIPAGAVRVDDDGPTAFGVPTSSDVALVFEDDRLRWASMYQIGSPR